MNPTLAECARRSWNRAQNAIGLGARIAMLMARVVTGAKSCRGCQLLQRRLTMATKRKRSCKHDWETVCSSPILIEWCCQCGILRTERNGMLSYRRPKLVAAEEVGR